MLTISRLATAWLVLAVFAVPAYAQRNTGDILGSVKDSSGGVLPGVTITVTHLGTGLVRTVVTNESGDYVVPSLPIGQYEVAAELPGFQKASVTGVTLQFDQRARIDLALRVGTLEESLTVVGSAPLIETDTSTVGQVMASKVVEALPLNKRDYLSLTLLTPGVVPAQQGSIVAFFRGAVQVNGAREEANNFMLDGMQNKDNMIQGIVVQPSLDAIAEFKVQSSTYSAEYGHGGGAQINIITKSGTNDFRGSLFEFHRDERFDARNFFAPRDRAKPKFQMDQFGGSVGGPIRKGKLFFFANYEGRRLAQETPKAATVPTEAMRVGNFSGRRAIYDPLTYNPATGTRQQFPGNVIPADRISPLARQIVGLLPLPNQGGALNFLGTPEFTDDMDTMLARVDQQMGADTLTFRYAYYKGLRFSPYQRFNDRDLPGWGDTFDARDHSAMASWTKVMGSNKVNEVKFGFAGVEEGFLALNRNIDYVGQLGIRGLPDDPRFYGMPQTFITGIGSFGDGCCFPQIRWDRKYQFVDNFTLTRGSHAFKMGADFTYYHQQMFLHSRERLSFIPNFTRDPLNAATTGDAFADFLLGYPTQTFRRVGLEESNLRTKFFQFYFLDDWNVNAKLTLNLGVRYEYQTPYIDVFDHRASFDPVARRLIYPNDPPGTSRALYDPDKNNIAPRIGMAYRLNNRTVLRSGYGIYYSPENGNGQDNIYRNEPFTRNQTFNAAPVVPNLTLATPYPQEALGIGTQNVIGIDRKFPMGYTHQWSVNVQHALTKAIALDIGYVGNRGVDLQNNVEINQPVPGATPIQSRRPFPEFGSISIYQAIFPSRYHSLQTKVQGRWGAGSSLLASYTLSRSRDILSSYYGGGSIQNFNDLDDSWGASNFDRRHVLSVSFVSDLPFGPGKRFLTNARGLTNVLLGNWQVNAIAQFSSGNPVTIVLATNHSGTVNFQDRPNVIGDPTPANQGPSNWIDPAAFELPAPFTFGNAGRNSVVGPGINRIDFSLFKNIPVGGDRRLQLRFEAFNLFNTQNFFQPNRIWGTPQFGKITQAYDGRDIQFGVRFSF